MEKKVPAMYFLQKIKIPNLLRKQKNKTISALNDALICRQTNKPNCNTLTLTARCNWLNRFIAMNWRVHATFFKTKLQPRQLRIQSNIIPNKVEWVKKFALAPPVINEKTKLYANLSRGNKYLNLISFCIKTLKWTRHSQHVTNISKID